MSCYDQEMHVVACEAYREVIAERGSDPGLRAVIEALVISTITRQSQGIEMEAGPHQRGGVAGEALRELLQERGRL